MRIEQIGLMERLWLVKSVPVLSSNDVCVQVCLSLPRGLVLQLRVCLKTTCNRLGSVLLSLRVVELALLALKLDVCVGFGPGLRVEVGFPEGRAPLFVQGWVGFEQGCLAVPSEESWSRFVESPLVGLEATEGSKP